MTTRELPIVLLLFLSSFWFACHQEDITLDGPAVNITFAGRITDENDFPVAGATVSAGSESTTTDANGLFRLPELRLPAQNAILHVSRPGYFDFSRAFIVQNGAMQTVSIQLLQKKLIHSFLASQSTTAQAGVAKLRFPANSITMADGSAYAGVVSVYARYLDPTDPNLNRHMPGDLRGINTGGEEQTLATFGMIGVELTTPGGVPLRIASGKEVEISMPIPAAKQSVAPAEIALWHYDTEKARWIEEGSAQKSGDQYVGKVRHFSFWNCDVGIPLVILDGHIFWKDNQTPLSYAGIKLTILSSGWEGYGGTGLNGYFGGSVPMNEQMKMEISVLDQCGQFATIFSQTIGPFTAKTTLADIFCSGPDIEKIQISGRLVDCNNTPLPNGYVQVSNQPYSPLYFFAGADGKFNSPLFRCNNEPVDLLAVDEVNLKTSQPISISNPAAVVSLGDIPVCTLPGEFVEIAIDGVKHTFLHGFECLTEGGELYVLGSNDNSQIYFSFHNNGQAGAYSLTSFRCSPGADSLSAISIKTNLNAYGAKGQLATGTLSGTFQPISGPAKTVTGTYQVIRDN